MPLIKPRELVKCVIAIVLMVSVAGSIYVGELYEEGKIGLNKLASSLNSTVESQKALREAIPSVTELIENHVKAEQKGEDGALGVRGIAEWKILEAVTGLTTNGVMQELVFVDEWNRKIDSIFGSYFSKGTDEALEGILKRIGATSVSDYFSSPRSLREDANFRLKNVTTETPNELYAALGVYRSLTERRVNLLGIFILPVLLGILGSLVHISHGFLTDEREHIISYSRVGHSILRLAYGGTAGLLLAWLSSSFNIDSSLKFSAALASGFSLSLLANLLAKYNSTNTDTETTTK